MKVPRYRRLEFLGQGSSKENPAWMMEEQQQKQRKSSSGGKSWGWEITRFHIVFWKLEKKCKKWKSRESRVFMTQPSRSGHACVRPGCIDPIETIRTRRFQVRQLKKDTWREMRGQIVKAEQWMSAIIIMRRRGTVPSLASEKNSWGRTCCWQHGHMGQADQLVSWWELRDLTCQLDHMRVVFVPKFWPDLLTCSWWLSLPRK